MTTIRVLACTLAVMVAGSCKADSTAPEGSLVIDVRVSPPNLTLAVGRQGTLSATVTGPPGIPQGVLWRSSANSIATVSAQGVVTAVSEGAAFVRAMWALDTTVLNISAIQVTADIISTEVDAGNRIVRRQ